MPGRSRQGCPSPLVWHVPLGMCHGNSRILVPDKVVLLWSIGLRGRLGMTSQKMGGGGGVKMKLVSIVAVVGLLWAISAPSVAVASRDDAMTDLSLPPRLGATVFRGEDTDDDDLNPNDATRITMVLTRHTPTVMG